MLRTKKLVINHLMIKKIQEWAEELPQELESNLIFKISIKLQILQMNLNNSKE